MLKGTTIFKQRWWFTTSCLSGYCRIRTSLPSHFHFGTEGCAHICSGSGSQVSPVTELHLWDHREPDD